MVAAALQHKNRLKFFEKRKYVLFVVQNVGWRLDYVLVSQRLVDNLVDCIHRYWYRGTFNMKGG